MVEQLHRKLGPFLSSEVHHRLVPKVERSPGRIVGFRSTPASGFSSLGADGVPRTRGDALRTELSASLVEVVKDFEARKAEHFRQSKMSLGQLDRKMLRWKTSFEEKVIQERLDECQRILTCMQEHLGQFHSFRDKTNQVLSQARAFNTADSQFGRRDIARSFEKLMRDSQASFELLRGLADTAETVLSMPSENSESMNDICRIINNAELYLSGATRRIAALHEKVRNSRISSRRFLQSSMENSEPGSRELRKVSVAADVPRLFDEIPNLEDSQ